jgi:sugar phosphate isomerase/epimerase
MYSRREFGKLTLGTLALPVLGGAIDPRALDAAWNAAPDSTVGGVRLGVQTYSFRDLPTQRGREAVGTVGTVDTVDTVITAMTACGISECELWSPQIEPQTMIGGGGGGQRGGQSSPEQLKAREDLRKWRVETPIDHFRNVRKRFNTAGISIYAFNYSFNDGFSDQEIDRGFDMARALGAEIITASTTVPVAKRVAPFAEKHQMVVSMHGHSNVTDPKEFATPESFAAAMAMSKLFKINLDIGHFVAANYDPIAYIKEHHQDITNLHLKDRKKNQGDNTPWGQGETPIREVLQLLKKERWPVRAYIEYEYKGEGSPVEEVKKCYAYAKEALA